MLLLLLMLYFEFLQKGREAKRRKINCVLSLSLFFVLYYFRSALSLSLWLLLDFTKSASQKNYWFWGRKKKGREEIEKGGKKRKLNFLLSLFSFFFIFIYFFSSSSCNSFQQLSCISLFPVRSFFLPQKRAYIYLYLYLYLYLHLYIYMSWEHGI